MKKIGLTDAKIIRGLERKCAIITEYNRLVIFFLSIVIN